MQYTTRVKIAGYLILETDECRWGRTSGGDRWVLRPKGTKIALDALGRELFDMGSPHGKPCGNPSPYGISVNVPVLATPAAPAQRPPAPAPPTVAVAPAPRPATIPRFELPAARKPRLGITLGLGYVFGSVRSTYNEAIPVSGDTPQKHNFGAWMPEVRVDQGVDNGLFFTAGGSVLGSTSTMLFQDATGAWLDKNRTSDDSRNEVKKLKAGYQHTIGDYFKVAGFGGWQKFAIHEKYLAQGAATTSVRSYQGLILGGELAGSTDSLDHRATVTLSAEYGPLKRKHLTQQVYQAASLPRASDPDASGHSLGFRLGGEVQIYKSIGATASFNYQGFDSTRTNTFVADEHVGVKSVMLSVVYKWTR
ncbi:MAG: hypothetical protein A3H14_03200 [Candidatus Doudnabacteria bacterium RIFCSPLOWO2_12_FULL_49_8]|nr:MAG: hypothetical protein A3H14_03200 [Candidatus Doudnabacteria bacterium RIFCSPLOWO2_12_FULL_49_8]